MFKGNVDVNLSPIHNAPKRERSFTLFIVGRGRKDNFKFVLCDRAEYIFMSMPLNYRIPDFSRYA